MVLARNAGNHHYIMQTQPNLFYQPLIDKEANLCNKKGEYAINILFANINKSNMKILTTIDLNKILQPLLQKEGEKLVITDEIFENIIERGVDCTLIMGKLTEEQKKAKKK